MLEGIQVFTQNSIKIEKEKIIYMDTYEMQEEKHDADIIFITHTHYDHFSLKDIEKVKKKDTVIVGPKGIEEVQKIGFLKENIKIVKPNQSYEIKGIKVETVPAYNLDKKFHPKENEWVGYILNLQGAKYYIAGDTDDIEEIRNIKCDVAFIPIGGTYTMDAKEAATLVNVMQPKIVVPTHYGSIVGRKEDAQIFAQKLKANIQCEVYL